MDIENLENKEKNTMDDNKQIIENLENEDSKYVENNKFKYIGGLIINIVNDLKTKNNNEINELIDDINELENEREKIKEILNIKSDDIIENLHNNNNSVFFEILILFYFIFYSIIFYYINTYLLYSYIFLINYYFYKNLKININNLFL